MDLSDQIYAILSAHAPLAAVVGPRLYPVEPPANTPVPFVRWRTTSSESTATLDGNLSFTKSTVTVDVVALTLEQAQQVNKVVKALLNNYRGGSIQSAVLTGQSYEEVEEGYLAVQTYKVFTVDSDEAVTSKVTTGSDYVQLEACSKVLKLDCTGLKLDGQPVGGDALPPQPGNGGNYLRTDGLQAAWEPILTPNLAPFARKDEANLFASPSATSVPITITGATGQTADLTQWKDANGQVRLRVGPTGTVTVQGYWNHPTQKLVIDHGGGLTWTSGLGQQVAYLGPDPNNANNFQTSFPIRTGTGDWHFLGTPTGGVFYGNAFGTNSWEGFALLPFGANGAQGHGTYFRVNMANTRTMVGPGVAPGGEAGQLHVLAGSASTVGAVIQAVTAQTADLLQCRAGTGAVVASVTADGTVDAPAGLVLTSPAGTRYRVAVADDGTLSTAAA